ncbi:amino acid ABC transporter ATP-binding protein [Paenibacillus sp. HB172176]|uniref:amino acid ABC transporter ATP-binding protein n=1 Tax=Paenibacillus sp. HB172176 TaxID=2493690 RepID=UPI00143C0FD5|nr:amino acid ABC transporter ATP-binding protein [Paenibacillus sp. HB172176]
MIEMRDLHKSYGTTEVLSGIDITLDKGKVLVIIGPSGSGKTTLLRCFNLLEIPDNGSMRLMSNSFDFQRGQKPPSQDILKLRRQTGMVFQSFNLFPHMTAIENVMEAQMTVRKKKKREARAYAEEQLRKVGLTDKANAYPHQLSGGQQQRVAIARAMAMDPEVLLFDEPTSALDPELVGDVLGVMKQLAAEGMTMIIVTHEMKFAADVADHLILIDNGRIIEQGPPQGVLKQPKTPRAMQFLTHLGAGTAVLPEEDKPPST